MTLFSLCVLAGLYQKDVEYSITGQNGGLAVIRARDFRPSGRNLRIVRSARGRQFLTVDGYKAWGVGGDVEAHNLGQELVYLRVRFPDKRERTVPERLIRGLFGIADPATYASHATRLEFSKDGQVAKLRCTFGDGYGGYRVMWTIWQNGKAKREVNPTD
jgi:hypothetical protein